jgi:nitrogen regulatory protein PII
MFMITAVIQPLRLQHVRSELLSAGMVGLTVFDCVGHGRHPKMIPSLKGGPDVSFLERNVKIEIAVPADNRDVAIDAIERGARLGGIGGGKIFVAPIERVVSIRTGLENEFALSGPDVWTEAAE